MSMTAAARAQLVRTPTTVNVTMGLVLLRSTVPVDLMWQTVLGPVKVAADLAAAHPSRPTVVACPGTSGTPGITR